MSKYYLFISIFLMLFAVNANAFKCPDVGQTAKILTIQDLQNINLCLPATGMTFWVANDLDAKGFPFQTIGSGSDKKFDGTIDGGGNIIHNLSPETDGGLVNQLSEVGVIKNMALKNIIVHGGGSESSSYGGLVNVSQGKISHVSILSGTVTGKTPSYLGGLVGIMIQGEIIDSSSSVILIPGVVQGKPTKYNGVFVGWQRGGLIILCTSSGSIRFLRSETEDNGGMVGLQSNDGVSENPVITRSKSSTIIDLKDTTRAEGNGVFAGAVSNGIIYDSFANGGVTGPTNSNVKAISGGFVGYLGYGGTIKEVYSSSTFSNGDPNADGGLVGVTPFAHNDISCTNSYWDADVSKLPYSSACPEGARSTELMKKQSTYDGWSPLIWGFGQGYPTLLGVESLLPY